MLIYFNFNLALQTKLPYYPGAGEGGWGGEGGKELWYQKDGVDGQEPLKRYQDPVLWAWLEIIVGLGYYMLRSIEELS